MQSSFALPIQALAPNMATTDWPGEFVEGAFRGGHGKMDQPDATCPSTS